MRQHIHSLVDRELDSYEQVLWTGQPIAIRAFLHSLWIYLFALPWNAFSWFMFLMMLGAAWPPLFGGEQNEESIGAFGVVGIIFMIPFICVGAWLFAVAFLVHRAAKNTVYAITDKHVLTIINEQTKSISAVKLKDLSGDLIIEEKKDGSGNLYYKHESYRNSDNDLSHKKVGFEQIGKVRDAREVLKRAIEDVSEQEIEEN